MTSLAGRRIVVTREESETGPLSGALRAAGALPLLSPTVEIAALHDPEERRNALPPLDGFDWLVVTSPRTVTLLAEAGALPAPRPGGLRVAAVGERTAAAVAEAGWTADRVPEDAGAEPLLRSLLDAAADQPAPPGSVLFPASARAGRALETGLTAAGFDVFRVDLYAPRPRPQDRGWWADRVREGLDALTFTSPSAVSGLVHGLADAALLTRLLCLPAGVQGPTTASAAREAGWTDIVEARPRSFPGLVDALEAWFLAASDPTADLLRA